MTKTKQFAAAIIPFLFSFIASSHHWLHMGILFVLGGSSHMMSTMSTVFWLRRFMIIMTIVTVIFSVYQLYRHRCKQWGMIAMTAISTIVSLGFIVYTLVQFGW